MLAMMKDLGLIESSVLPVDELGTNDAGPELSTDDHCASDMDEESLPLGQWATMPRRSRRVAGQAFIDPFVDVESLENHGT